MCLVNELARFNKIQPEYKLLREQGPAHCKVNIVHTACAFITHQECFLSFYAVPSGAVMQNTCFPVTEAIFKRCKSRDFGNSLLFILAEWVKEKTCFFLGYVAFKTPVSV